MSINFDELFSGTPLASVSHWSGSGSQSKESQISNLNESNSQIATALCLIGEYQH